MRVGLIVSNSLRDGPCKNFCRFPFGTRVERVPNVRGETIAGRRHMSSAAMVTKLPGPFSHLLDSPGRRKPLSRLWARSYAEIHALFHMLGMAQMFPGQGDHAYLPPHPLSPRACKTMRSSWATRMRSRGTASRRCSTSRRTASARLSRRRWRESSPTTAWSCSLSVCVMLSPQSRAHGVTFGRAAERAGDPAVHVPGRQRA